jgi:hypothetical protein
LATPILHPGQHSHVANPSNIFFVL